jgi:TatA/E family protein of Tat protein translocase
MGPIGVQEMIFIFLLALLLFGPKKLPELGRMLGKGLTEFRRAKNELKTTFESHMRELEREANTSSANSSSSTSTSLSYQPKPYSYPYDEQGYASQNSDPYRPYDYSVPAQNNGVQEVEQEHSPALNGTAAQHDVREAEPVAGTVPRGSAVSAPEANTPAEEEHRV